MADSSPHSAIGSQSILDAVEAPVFSVDRDYRYLAFNHAHAATMQALYSADIKVGDRLLDYQTPEDAAEARRNIDRALEGEELTESAWSGVPGSRRHFTVSHAPIWKGTTVVGATIVAMDTTSQALAERKAELEQRDVLDAVGSPVFAVDTSFRYLIFNDAHRRVMHDTYGAVIADGESILELITVEADRERVRETYTRAFAGETVRDNCWYGDQDETRRYFAATMSPLVSEGMITGVVVAAVDETAEALAKAQLLDLATHDPLTGLPNRRALENAVRRAISMADLGHASMLIFADVNGFKQCNDLRGHAFGDGVLKEVAGALESVVRGNDMVARVGGDEFGVLLLGRTEVDAAEMGERLDAAVREAGARLDVDLSLSVGSARVRSGSTMLDVLGEADSSMYAAKRAAR